MTAETQAPQTPQAPTPPSLGIDRSAAAGLAIVALLVMVVGLVFGVISMNTKLDELQAQVANLPSGSTTVVDTSDITVRLDDACRALGALAFKAGVDLPTAFANEGATGACEDAAEGAFHRLKTR